MTRRATLFIVPLLGASLALPVGLAQAAPGNISAQVRQVYEQDQTIPACRFTSQQLTTAENTVDAYDLEYFADYIAAIQNALTLRAAGACTKHAAPIGHAPLGRTPPSAPLPATLTSSTSSGFPLPILLMAIFAVVLAVAAAILTLLRSSSAAWAGRWRHGTADARYRAAGARDRITDRWKR